MNRDEYAIMFRVEDRHWWYAGLRGMLDMVWNQYVPAGSSVLDVGCGTGANLSAFHGRFSLVGIDIAAEAVRLCRKRGEARTAVASATALPFADEAFDGVFSCDVLCHTSIADKSVALRELCRVVRQGGAVILNLPAYQWLYSSHDLHVQTDHRFTAGEVHALLIGCGLEPLRITYWNTLLFPVAAATRLWRKLKPRSASDLNGAALTGMNDVLIGILKLERAIFGTLPLPVGLSVLAVARKVS